jgi:hypothetical protein
MPIKGGLDCKKITGPERDPETGLDCLMAGYYEPAFGHLLTLDPLGFRSILEQEALLSDPATWK